MDFSQLKQISDLKYQKSEQAIAEITAQENRLRSELQRLQSLVRETHSAPASDAELRSIGGDVIWLKWLASAQRQLNVELAQVLAQKENVMARHRTASGKKAVADKLLERSGQLSRNMQMKRALDQAIETALVPNDFNSPGVRSRR